jgi:rubredoxin
MCLICGWIYDEAAGAPDHGIAPGTVWADVPMNWTCPNAAPARKTSRWWKSEALARTSVRDDAGTET